MKIYTLGSYSDVEGNMTAVEVNGKIIILDMGISMPKWVTIPEEEKRSLGEDELKELGVLPDDSQIDPKKVVAIVISHAHMDHYYGIFWLAEKYKSPIIMTPFTYEVVKRDEFVSRLKNKVIQLNPGDSYKIGDFKINFIYSTHSVPQTVMIYLETPEKNILYANDWKYDVNPTLGKRMDFNKLKELDVDVLITDCIRTDEPSRTLSEGVVREMMKDILKKIDDEKSAIFVTTFASHIARLNWLVKLSYEIGRVPVMLGRSMKKYTRAAESVGIANFKGIKRENRNEKVIKILKKVEKNRSDYLLIVTGGQGEPGSILKRIAEGKLKFEFTRNDHVVFLNRVIPNPINQAHRAILERELGERGVRILKDIHASGHASREDLRDLIRATKPRYFIPAHAGPIKQAYAIKLAMEEGYEVGKSVFMSENGRVIEI